MAEREGRPSKLTESFLKEAEEVIEGTDVVYCTDEELVFLINERLPEKEQISNRTFERWKARDWEKLESVDAENGRTFCRLLKKALIEQKRQLFKRMDESTLWQREAWKIERKFDEWNIKRKVGVSADRDGAAALAASMFGESDEE